MIEQHLLEYLRGRLGTDAAYRETPKALSGGFVTDVYGFALTNVPDEWSGPLVLRVYPPNIDRLDVERERCAQEVVAAQGAPAPKVLACEPEPASLDRAFMVMERLPGRPQMNIEFPQMLLQAPRLFTLPRRHAGAMRLVHALDAQPLIDAFAAAGIDRRHAGPEHWLDGAGELIDQWELRGLRAGLEWLLTNRPPDPSRVSICHGDLFGANILETKGVVTGLIDWNLVTVAEPAFDLGGQIAANQMSAVPGPRVVQLAVMGFGRLLARGLSRAYGAIDDDRVAYYAAMRAFTEMTFKLAAQARVAKTGVPERMATWRPEQCARYFLDRTGVRVET